ncbi:MAG: hypothetical protein AB9869_00590 [Verrucomicrobiia bacterium]
MTPETKKLYSARELAAAAGLSKRAVLALLASVPPGGRKEAPGGQKALAWAQDVLPDGLRRELVKAAESRQCATLEALLAIPTERSHPAAISSHRARRLEDSELRKEFHALAEQIDPEDGALLWHKVFTFWEALPARRDLKADLVELIRGRFPMLASTRQALRWAFNHKLTRWQHGGRSPQALEDRRPMASGRFGPKLCDDCRKKLIDLAILLDGDESQAWRRLRKEGKFCERCMGLHSFDERRHKSDVPDSVREEITPLVDMAWPYRRGPKYARLAGPYVPRDWSDTKPGDYFCADDVTWNHDFWYEDEHGQKHIARGECLVMTDLRTDYPLDFLLIAGHYNSAFIRSLVLSVHDKQGLPSKGFYFENGVWRARLIEGERHTGAIWNHWRETEKGLCDPSLGLVMRHATTPRAKPIERVFGIIQNRMRCEPGFVGFNERSDNREWVSDFRARVRAGKEHPGNELLSMDEWRTRISEILLEFAQEPQNGNRLPGISPLEAWTEAIDKRPLRKLPDSMRYLLATHKKPVSVTQQGILIQVRGQRFVYYNENTSKFIGQEVLAFFNLDCPELLVFSDIKRQEYFSVEAVSAPAMTADANDYERVNHARKGHLKAAKALFGNIQHPLGCQVTRDTEHSARERELGEFINEVTEDHKQQEHAEKRKITDARRAASALGVNLPTNPRNVDRIKEGLDRLQRALKNMEDSQ